MAHKEDVASALVASDGFAETSNGFAGVNDGYTDLLVHHRLTWRYATADSGNVVQVARIAHPQHFTLALGFGDTPSAAVASARASLGRGFDAVRADYAQGWSSYLKGLRHRGRAYEKEFQLAAMVVRAHEDKTYPGAIIASMSIPWGYAVQSDKPNVGGYHLVWARDLYEAASSLMVAGDTATARRAAPLALRRAAEARRELPAEQLARRTSRSGRRSQMDESVLSPRAGLAARHDGRGDLGEAHPPGGRVRAGPRPRHPAGAVGGGGRLLAFHHRGGDRRAGVRRGHRPEERRQADARRYLAKADDWAIHVEKWMVTTTGHLGAKLAPGGYYMRIDNNTDPNDGYRLDDAQRRRAPGTSATWWTRASWSWCAWASGRRTTPSS